MPEDLYKRDGRYLIQPVDRPSNYKITDIIEDLETVRGAYYDEENFYYGIPQEIVGSLDLIEVLRLDLDSLKRSYVNYTKEERAIMHERANFLIRYEDENEQDVEDMVYGYFPGDLELQQAYQLFDYCYELLTNFVLGKEIRKFIVCKFWQTSEHIYI